MPEKQRIDVFISSTSKDLEDYRKAVKEAILDLGLFPSGMENWAVTGSLPVELCRQMIRDADIYLGIYAHRYGWQPDGYDGKSITELEFDWAGDVRRDGEPIPRLCFVIKDDYPWSPTAMELEKKKQLDSFKDRVKSLHAGFFTTPENLRTQVTAALAKVVRERFQHAVSVYKCNLAPKPPDYFIGRHELLNILLDRLSAADTAAVMVLRGIGGIGKSTLAQALAQAGHSSGRFGIVLWAEIGEQWDDGREIRTLRGWAKELAGRDLPDDWNSTQLAEAVRSIVLQASLKHCGEPILLILDDVWHSTYQAAERLRQRAVPNGARTLITTRQPEVAIDMDVLAESVLRVQDLPPDEGARLITAIIGKDKADFALLATLSEALGGHPLSLRLAARQLRKTSDLPAVVAQLKAGIAAGDAFSSLRLDTGERREDSVSVTLQLTYQNLTGDQQMRFRALGVLPLELSFSRAHLYHLWMVNDASAVDELLLEGLLDEASGEAGRFMQHRTLRLYARGLLRQHGEFAAMRERHWEYMIALADQAFDHPPEQWHEFAADFPMINAAGNELVSAVTGTDDTAVQDAVLQGERPLPAAPEAVLEHSSSFGVVVSPYISRRSIGREGWRWLSLGLIASRALQQPYREARFLNNIGLWFSARGDDYKHIALDYYQQSLTRYQELDDQSGQGLALHNIGTVYKDLQDLPRALEFLEQALLLRQQCDDQQGVGATLNSIGNVYSDSGDNQRALSYFEQALPIRRALEDRTGEAITLNSIGTIYDDRGESQQALAYYEQSLPLLHAAGDRASEAITCINIGTLYRQLHDFSSAAEYLLRSVTLMEQIEHPLLAQVRNYLHRVQRERDGNG